MTVYVDESVWPFRGERYCHMATDGDLEELHQLAASIGMKRQWFQEHPTLPHYDLSPSMRAKAVQAGAVAVKSTELARKCSSLLKAARARRE